MPQRQNETPRRSVERRARVRVHPLAGFEPHEVPLERVDRELVVGRQRGMGGRQELEAQVFEIERAHAQSLADSFKQRSRRRRFPDQRDVALRRDQRVERVEQDADRGGKAQTLSPIPRPVEQKSARRLQLLGERRLLADRGAVGGLEILVGIKYARDRARVDREFADRF